MKKLTAFILAMLLACGTIIGCEKGNPDEETTKHQNETVETKPVETKAPKVSPVEGEIINLVDEGILISSNSDANVADAFDLDISTAVRLDAANSDNWIGIELPQSAILCYASFSAQDTDYDGTTNSPWDIYGHIVEGSNDGQNWEFILQFGDPYAEYDEYGADYDKGINYATEYAFDGESEYDDDATEAKAYRYYRSWNDGKGGPLWGELELWGVLVGEPVETKSAETEPTTVLDKYIEHDFSQQGFSIRGNGYYYKGHRGDYLYGFSAGDVLLFDIKNETDTNYSVILTVTYFDENGKGIKLEKKKFDQFAAGYQRYFLFTPRTSFDSYTCELSITEYSGEINHLDMFSSYGFYRTFERKDSIWDLICENNDFTEYPTIMTQLVTNERPHPERLFVDRTIIIFDNTGEIYLIAKGANDKFEPIEEAKESYFDIYLYQTTEKELVWPEELKGELGLISIWEIVDWEFVE